MADILFATNRARTDNGTGTPQFGNSVMPMPNGLWCGVATVDGISNDDPATGTISGIAHLNWGWLAQAQIDALAQSGNDLLVFVHGTDNDFADAVARGAYNQTWMGKVAGRGIDVVVFSWPSQAYDDLINIFEDHTDYEADQKAAAASAPHFGLFLQQLLALKPRLDNRTVSILCHSMGNYMLGAAVEAWFAQPQTAPPLFAQAILAAADEPSTTFLGNRGKRLSKLRALATAVTVYFNDNDILMALSDIVNPFTPLGLAGPTGASNTHIYPTDVYQFVDCTNIADYVGPRSFDESHQYYRQSPTVRADIVAVLLGNTPNRYYYDPSSNIWDIVMPPIDYPVS